MRTRLLSGVLCVYGKTIVPQGLTGPQFSFNFTIRFLQNGGWQMTDEKLNTGPEEQKTEEATAPFVADPAHREAPTPEHQPEQTGLAEPGDW